MSDEPSIRPAEPDDAPRVREVADSTFTQSYALSPQDIETILNAEFDEESLREQFGNGDGIALVAENEGVLAGFAEMDPEEGTIRWLHVDPERRGAGIGTALFEQAVSTLEEEGVDDVRGVVLSSNTAAGAFFERFDYGKIEERQTTIDGLEVVEYVFAEGATGESESTASEDTASGNTEEQATRETTGTASVEADLPDTATTDDGDEVYVGSEATPGTEGGFSATYTDEDRSEKYGYYCANCGSTDVSMDSMERLKCQNCGNVRRPDDDYDGSYL